MNKAFDYNGTLVAPSNPKKQLRTVKKTVLIDSADRDVVKYYTNGDVVYYLPRVYENVVSIRLKSATFPVLAPISGSGGALIHSYANGKNTSSATYSSDSSPNNTDTYFLLDIEGLNKCDETTIGAQRSTYVDNYFARIPTSLEISQVGANTCYFINYNDSNQEENIGQYSPPIGKLDRLHIVTRLHSQQDKSGFIYFTTDGSSISGSNSIFNYSLVFEVTMLDNGFDDFSSLESRINNRELGNYGC